MEIDSHPASTMPPTAERLTAALEMFVGCHLEEAMCRHQLAVEGQNQ